MTWLTNYPSSYSIDDTPQQVALSEDRGEIYNLRADAGAEDANGIDFSFSTAVTGAFAFTYTHGSVSGGSNYLDRHLQLFNLRTSNGDPIIEVFVYPGNWNIYIYDHSVGNPGYNEYRDYSINTGIDVRSNHTFAFYWDPGTSEWNFVIDDGSYSRTIQNFNSALASLSINGVRAAGYHSGAIEYDLDVTPQAPELTNFGIVNGTDVTADWQPIIFTDYYKIERSIDETSWTTLSNPTATTTSYTDAGVEEGAEYHYRFRSGIGPDTANPNWISETASTDAAAFPHDPPTLNSVTASGVQEVSLDFARNDTGDDGTINVYRDDGSGEMKVAELGLDQTSYVDSDPNILEGEEYTYWVVRASNDTTSSSSLQTVITVLQSVDGLVVTSVSGRYASLEATDPSNNSAGYRLLLREDGASTYNQDGSDYAPVSEGSTVTFDTTELLDGQQYDATVETYTEHTTAREDQ